MRIAATMEHAEEVSALLIAVPPRFRRYGIHLTFRERMYARACPYDASYLRILLVVSVDGADEVVASGARSDASALRAQIGSRNE
ncbi:hypothetical protein Y032_0002g926 [Ancylostoma ceylanicum]|uniref:Uncharacterized protein n=1 Tax=Ancylostoma ceylanicum TaxID=53326 RepID=A0A016W3W0_9BILA|nr:hypothetical protein Y032_0002g926 [Ancylostoma ceylanicum]